MDPKAIDWSALDALDELIHEFVTPSVYPSVQKPLQTIADETERIVACLTKIDDLLTTLRSERGRIQLPEPWLPNPHSQIITLEEGFKDLVEVATIILPHHALGVLKNKMH